MNFSKLSVLVRNYAHSQRECAAYNGAHNDGGEGQTLSMLQEFKQQLIVEYDLRPSEYYELNDKEVGEPSQFSKVFIEERKRLANDIKL